jgi:hypothetical protein
MKDDKYYDEIVIKTSDGTRLSYFFNITSFFGGGWRSG